GVPLGSGSKLGIHSFTLRLPASAILFRPAKLEHYSTVTTLQENHVTWITEHP
ncbi:hypothetical protein COCMIDRAFT_100460, partial [Bipolaris oryzae ATCC 44560]